MMTMISRCDIFDIFTVNFDVPKGISKSVLSRPYNISTLFFSQVYGPQPEPEVQLLEPAAEEGGGEAEGGGAGEDLELNDNQELNNNQELNDNQALDEVRKFFDVHVL